MGDDKKETLRWNRFHSLWGAEGETDLTVGFKTIVSKENALHGLDEKYLRARLVHDNPKETVKLVYEPAVVQPYGVTFAPASIPDFFGRKLEFHRKDDKETMLPRRWIVAARHGESSCFGFSAWDSKNSNYLALAFPTRAQDGSSTGEFLPLYLKTEGAHGDIYLVVGAKGDGDKIAVSCVEVEEEDAPE